MKKFLFGINNLVLNKTPRHGSFEALQENWQTHLGTVEDLAYFIKQGFAFMPGLLDGDRRSKANVKAAQMVAIDIDQGLSIKEAAIDPFIKQYCALAYTTHSHQKPKGKEKPCDRFRLIFVLPCLITDIEQYEAIVASIMEILPHDKACKDASRFFYGNSEADILFSDRSKILPGELLKLASQKIKVKRESKNPVLNLQFSNSNDLDKLILEALSFIPPRQPGTGNYHQSLRVAMALHSHYGIAAIPIIEQWSPSIRGTTWNVPLKVRSFKRQGVKLATLFWIAKQYGHSS